MSGLIHLLGLPTLLSYPITLFLHYFSVPATIWLRPWLKALSRSKNYTSQRTLLYLTKVALRGSGERSPGLSPPSQLSMYGLPGDRSLACIVSSFVLKDVQTLRIVWGAVKLG